MCEATVALAFVLGNKWIFEPNVMKEQKDRNYHGAGCQRNTDHLKPSSEHAPAVSVERKRGESLFIGDKLQLRLARVIFWQNAAELSKMFSLRRAVVVTSSHADAGQVLKCPHFSWV